MSEMSVFSKLIYKFNTVPQKYQRFSSEPVKVITTYRNSFLKRAKKTEKEQKLGETRYSRY